MLEHLPAALGHRLRERRAGEDKLAFYRHVLGPGHGEVELWSPAFEPDGPLPTRCTADGDGTSPPLQWLGVPDQAVELLLLVEDADSPTHEPLVHCIATDIPGGQSELAEGALNAKRGGIGRNSYLRTGWLPPDPPRGHGVHRYAFQLFALRGDPKLGEHPGRGEVLRAVDEFGMASGILVGTYERRD